MHEVSQRWALTMSVIAAIEGVVSLIAGTFIAPIPQQTATTPLAGSQLITAVFIRGILALIALAVAFVLAYYAGYRIQATFEPSANAPTTPAAASSALFALFATPGPRRDAVYAGAITLTAYWFFTTIYIAALGNAVGGVGGASNAVSFVFSRLVLALALAAAGAGAGGLGARNAVTRSLTRRIFATPQTEAPSAPALATPPQTPPQQPSATSESVSHSAESE